jgi:hypothetical protein
MSSEKKKPGKCERKRKQDEDNGNVKLKSYTGGKVKDKTRVMGIHNGVSKEGG